MVNEPNMGVMYQIEDINRAVKDSKEFLKNLNEQDARRRLNFAIEYLSNIMPQPLEISLPQNMIDFDRLDMNIRRACFDIAKIINWNCEAVLFALIGYINSAMRARYKIHITDQWIEKSPLFLILIGRGGSIKSGLHEMLAVPFNEIQKEIDIKYQEEMKGAADYKKIVDSGRHELAKDYGKLISHNLFGRSSDIDIDLIKELAESYHFANQMLEKEILKKFNSIRYLVSDTGTDINLLKRMRDSGGGQAIISPEMKTFVERIKKKKIDVRIFNSGYDLERIDYGSERNSISISEAFLTMLFYSQPNVTLDFFKNNDVISTGFGSRFVTIFIDKQLNFFSDTNCNIESVSIFNNIIKKMIMENIEMSMNYKYYDIILDEQVSQLFRNYRNDIEMCKGNYDNEVILQTLNRLPGLAIRFATTLKAFSINSRYSRNLDETHFLSGMELANYSFYNKILICNPDELAAIEDAKKILKWAYENNYPDFTDREVAQRSPVRKMPRVHAALDLLERKQYLAQIRTGRLGRICGLNLRQIQANSYLT